MSAFNHEKYIELQSQNIRSRIEQFNNKLYLEFGGKIFDDYHASRVLPGFKPDSKVQMLLSMKENVEIVIAINAQDIQKSKMRGDNKLTYEDEVFRMIEQFTKMELYVGSVVITNYKSEPLVEIFRRKLRYLGIPVFFNYFISGYPYDTNKVVSEEGFGKNQYIKTTRSLIVVTAPGPGSGKMSTCLSQLYHENKNGINAGYAKYETFPVWNLPLKHPVNLAYEAATADLDDVNMIDPYHLNKYQIASTNYNRDVEVYPILEALFKKIYGESPYFSPTDMGVNVIGFCLNDEEEIKEACKQEIIRRYFDAKCNVRLGTGTEREVEKIELIMNQIDTSVEDRKSVTVALEKTKEKKVPILAIELKDGSVITGKQTNLFTASSACILNAIKYIAGIKDKLKLISPKVINPIQELKENILYNENKRLDLSDVLTALSITATTNPIVEDVLLVIKELAYTEAHSTVILPYSELQILKKLKINVTCEPIMNSK